MIDKSWNPVENGGDRKARLDDSTTVTFTGYKLPVYATMWLRRGKRWTCFKAWLAFARKKRKAQAQLTAVISAATDAQALLHPASTARRIC